MLVLLYLFWKKFYNFLGIDIPKKMTEMQVLIDAEIV